MIIKNLTNEASRALNSISNAHDEFSKLLYTVDSREEVEILLNGLKYLDVCMDGLVKILAQNQGLTIES